MAGMPFKRARLASDFEVKWEPGNDLKATFRTSQDNKQDMVNLKVGGALLVAGAVLFLLSNTVFGDSEAATYSVFLGLIMFPVGVILTLVGAIQVLIAKFKGRSESE